MSSAAQTTSSASAIRSNSLAEGVLILFALTIVQRLVGFVRGICFCRWLDAEQLGRWDLAFSFLLLAAPLAVLGLPGSFGRYVETYRRAGQLRSFLRRTTIASFLPAALFCVALAAASEPAAEFLFGSRGEADLVRAMAWTLGACIGFNYLTCLFTALRAGRIVSYLQFSNTALFAGASWVLLVGREARATSAVAAFGMACLASMALALVWIVRLWRELPRAESSLPHAALWSRLMPFAFWVWMTNWISNSFEIVDRYLIVHFSGLAPHESLQLVGQYHSARLMPALFLGLADLLATLVTPHLVHDWESGRREAVAARLRLILKLFVVAFLSASIVLVLASPLFFHTALADKFGFGQAIFPWVLACALWTGMAMISHNWLWCAEKSRLVCVGLTVGLLTSIGLNLLWLPKFGLDGVVTAAAIAKPVALGVLWLICRRLGLRFDRGLIIAAILPALLFIGPWAAAVALAAAASGKLRGLRLFDADERRQIGTALAKIGSRLPRLARFKTASGGAT